MRIRTVVGAFAAGLVLGPGLFVGGLSLTGRAPSYCEEFSLPEPGGWRALDGDDQLEVVSGLSSCGRLDGLAIATVAEVFGAPDDQRIRADGSTVLVYAVEPTGDAPAEMRLRLVDGRVVTATVDGARARAPG